MFLHAVDVLFCSVLFWFFGDFVVKVLEESKVEGIKLGLGGDIVNLEGRGGALRLRPS